MKSIIEKRLGIEEGKVLKITIDWQNPMWEQRRAQLYSSLPDTVTKKEMEDRFTNLVLRESFFNKAMDYLSKQYTFKISESELKEKTEEFKVQMKPTFEEANKHNPGSVSEQQFNDFCKNQATTLIIRELIFEDIAKDKKIVVTDDEAKESLKSFHEQTGGNIDSLLKGSEFETIKKLVLDNKIMQAIIEMFKYEPEDTKK